MTTEAKTRLFVMSGGGMPGLDLHVGIWRALETAGILATEISATSAGAIVGAANVVGWHAAGFEEYLRQHKSSDVRHEHLFWKVRAPFLESIHDSDRIRIILDGIIPPAWGKIAKPFHAWACRQRNGERINVARPELATTPAEAVLASMSISGIFPAVQLLDGENYVDGGLRFNLPLLSSWRDFDEVWLLIGQTRPQDYAGRGIISNLIRNINILSLDQIQDVLEETSGSPKVHVIWPDVHSKASLLQFDHDLIDAAYFWTINALQKAGRL